jgi:hypothetical protein
MTETSHESAEPEFTDAQETPPPATDSPTTGLPTTGLPTTGLPTTGDDAVDAVVATLRGLDDLPVSEHVAVFERAHESLRQVLSGAGEPVRAVQVGQA